ncbi:MAG: FHA domain-containing protein [Anaerolineae bacterium]|nr:FHA domain-containing protein [Anaerolineae bacterium]
MAARFRLIMNSGPTTGTAYPLEKGEITIGRDLGNDIVINDPEVSRHHSRLFLQGENYILEDRGSTNGTSVNGQRLLGPYTLRPGELITLGEHVSFIFENAQLDPDATIISSNLNQPVTAMPPVQPVAPPPPPPPAYAPPPVVPQYAPPPPPAPVQPQYTPSAQPQSYAGQVPMQPEPEPANKKIPVWLIILLIFIVVIVCGCGITMFFMPESWWCALFGWILNMMTPGVCPA